MPHVPARAFTLAVAFLVVVVAAVHFAPHAFSQTGPGWTTLFDGKSMGDWDRVGETNWRLEDGAIVADQRTSKEPPTWSRRARTRTSSSMSSSGRVTTPTAASSSAAAIPRSRGTGPATR